MELKNVYIEEAIIPDQFEQIASDNKDKIHNFIEYVEKHFELIPRKDLERQYVVYTLRAFQNDNKPSIDLREKRQRLVQDIKDLELCGVSSRAYDGVPTGKNTGMKANNEEVRLYKVEELRQELKREVAESNLLEQKLEKQNKLLMDFLKLLPNENYQDILKSIYVYNHKNMDISTRLAYSYETIKQYSKRGINCLTKIITAYCNMVNKTNTETS